VPKLKYISIVALAALALVLSCVPGALAQDQRDRWDKRNDQGQERYKGPGPHRGEWLRNHQSQPLPDQERALRNDPYFRQLSPERQQQLMNRLRDFNSRPPEQRQRMLERMETFEHLPQPERQQLRSYYGQIRDLPPDRRNAVNQAARQLSGMSPADRERVLNSLQFQRSFSPQEQNLVRGLTQFGPR
jgi:hypothetical protein